MSESPETICGLIEQCPAEERRAVQRYLQKLMPHPLELAWGIDSDTIMSAISRSSDLTKRGVRGIIAEAVFVDEIIPTVARSGWNPLDVSGDQPYDALLKKGEIAARIQVKLQRLEEGIPKLYYPRHYEAGTLFVVEVQKTRTGKKSAKNTVADVSSPTQPVNLNTRPYSFGDFDILAVNMHPSSGSWKNFRYTVASWLLPRPADLSLIEVFQPVASIPNDRWTEDLDTCLRWFESAKNCRVLEDLVHLKERRKKVRME